MEYYPQKLHQLAEEKKVEVESMLKVLQNKGKELGDEVSPLILERGKREAVLKEEIATLRKALERDERETALKEEIATLRKALEGGKHGSSFKDDTAAESHDSEEEEYDTPQRVSIACLHLHTCVCMCVCVRAGAIGAAGAAIAAPHFAFKTSLN